MLQKKKLLILMGAGTSIPCGLPRVSDIDTEMKKWAALEAAENFPDFLNKLWVVADRHDATSPFLFEPSEAPPNFEKILGLMFNLASWETPSPRGNPLRSAVLNGDMPTDWIVRFDRPDAYYGQKISILHQTSGLFGRLARVIRTARIRCVRWPRLSKNAVGVSAK